MMKIEYVKGSNVISIQPIRTQVTFPAIAQVDAYWDGLRNGRLMPTRSEVDPRALTEVLEFAFVLEKIAPGIARIRLGGHHLNDLMGMEVRGMPLTALFLPEARREMQRVLETVFESPATARLSLASPGGIGRAALEAQMFLAPMKGEDGVPNRILGALQAKGRIGRGPRRLEIRGLELSPLLVDDIVPGARREDSPRPMSTPPAPARPTPTIAKGGLRLVHDADAE